MDMRITGVVMISGEMYVLLVESFDDYTEVYINE
jgi:hypothetical protein